MQIHFKGKSAYITSCATCANLYIYVFVWNKWYSNWQGW